MDSFARRIRVHASQNGPDGAILGVDGVSISYHELWQGVCGTGQHLGKHEVKRGDSVVAVLPARAESAALLMCLVSNVACAPLSPACRKDECKDIIDRVSPSVVVINGEIDSPVREVALSRGIKIIDPSFSDLSTCVRPNMHEREADGDALWNRQENDIALLLSTSGTTSRPKIVPLTEGNLCSCADFYRKTYRLDCSDRCLCCMPLYHVHGLVAGIFSSVLNGASTVYAPRYDPVHYFEWLEKYEPTWITGVPTFYQALLSSAADHRHRRGPDSLRFIRSASSSLPPAVMKRLEELFGVPVIESYAMTEAASHISVNPMPPQSRKPGSVGLPAGPEVRIVDEAGNETPTGDQGEVEIRGANVITAYWEAAEENRKLFHDGWLRTGDQGFFDKDGYLFITGRIKEIIIRGGYNVLPLEIDNILNDHPEVIEAVAFGVEHTALGQDVVAAVILVNDSTATETELRDFISTRLADYKVPSRVVMVQDIPKGRSGKVERRLLAEQLRHYLESDFVPPQGELEEDIAAIWKQVLRVSRVSRNDSFYALGGDSLVAEQVAVRIQDVFGIELSGAQVLRAMTFTQLVDAVLVRLIQQVDNEELQSRIRGANQE